MAKYIVDIDALKDCINMLPIPYRINGVEMVCLDDVQKMIDKFPKDSSISNTPINYTGPIISTSPAVVPDTLKGWEVTCDSN